MLSVHVCHRGAVGGAYGVGQADAKAQQDAAADDHADVVSRSIQNRTEQVEDSGQDHVALQPDSPNINLSCCSQCK